MFFLSSPIFDSGGCQTYPSPSKCLFRLSILFEIDCCPASNLVSEPHIDPLLLPSEMLDLFLVTQPSNHKSPASDQIPSITTIDRPYEPLADLVDHPPSFLNIIPILHSPVTASPTSDEPSTATVEYCIHSKVLQINF